MESGREVVTPLQEIDLCKIMKCDKQERINNLQSKIDKANEILNKKYEEDKEIFKGDYDFKFILDFEEELLDILKED